MGNLTAGYHPQATEVPLSSEKILRMIEDAVVNAIGSGITWLADGSTVLNTSSNDDQAWVSLDLSAVVPTDATYAVLELVFNTANVLHDGYGAVRKAGGSATKSPRCYSPINVNDPISNTVIVPVVSQAIEWHVFVGGNPAIGWTFGIWLLGHMK